jgi:branched-chain amino acid aminotransferase
MTFQKSEKIWMDGKLVNWDDAKIHVLSHGLHYGSGVFEGIRFYKTSLGPAVFRLQEHIDRLYRSSRILRMKIPFSKEEMFRACVDIVRVNGLEAGYIRPIAYYGYGMLGVNPGGNPVNVAIAAWPWGKYLDGGTIKVKVTHFIRNHPKAMVASAKVCGHYVNSILANQEAKDADYTEALLLDYNGYVSEGPGENIVIVKDGILQTPPLGTILPGITRASVIQLAGDIGYEVDETPLTVDELQGADEAFFTGTAAEITPIHQVDEKVIGGGKTGPVTGVIQKEFCAIVEGRNERYHGWLTFVGRQAPEALKARKEELHKVVH